MVTACSLIATLIILLYRRRREKKKKLVAPSAKTTFETTTSETETENVIEVKFVKPDPHQWQICVSTRFQSRHRSTLTRLNLHQDIETPQSPPTTDGSPTDPENTPSAQNVRLPVGQPPSFERYGPGTSIGWNEESLHDADQSTTYGLSQVSNNHATDAAVIDDDPVLEYTVPNVPGEVVGPLAPP